MARGKKTGGRDWKPGESGNPAGGQPLPAEIKALRTITQKQVAEIASVILTGNLEKVKQVVADPNSTPMQVWFCTCILKGIAKGDAFAMDKLLERVIGKVKEKIDLSSSDGSMAPKITIKVIGGTPKG